MSDWYDKIGTTYENSPHREAPNRHERGTRKYKQMVERKSKEADKKNLPFTFSKPAKRTQPRRDILLRCLGCSNVQSIHKWVAGAVCNKCSKYISVSDSNTYRTEEDYQRLEKDLATFQNE